MCYSILAVIIVTVNRETYKKMILYDYQLTNKANIFESWERHKNVLSVIPTGGGKTAIFSNIIQEHQGASVLIAHRQELVSQISLALAGFEVRHRIVAPKKIIDWIIGLQVETYGRSFYDCSASCAVAGVDTLVRKENDKSWDQFFNQVSLWVIDEAHHLLKANKWGKAVKLFKNAKGLGVTATPCRADGKGLGDHADGYFHDMVLGPPMRELIERGYLSDYRVFCPQTKINLEDVPIGASGEFSAKPLTQSLKDSTIVGDVVEHYLKIAPGKQGITFAHNIDTAHDIALQYKARGVSAAVISSKTNAAARIDITRRFRAREINQIVNVDIFGEGVDIPSVEVISMARPTASYGLYSQQFGRALRIIQGKTHAIIIDHVGNVVRHRLPDAKRLWTLDRVPKRKKKEDEGIPIIVCKECTQPYEAVLPVCPECGYIQGSDGEGGPRGDGPQFVAGDLTEISEKVLREMRGDVTRVDEAPEDLQKRLDHSNMPANIVTKVIRNHNERQSAQSSLRESMTWWAGHQPGLLPEKYKRFWYEFGLDTMSAQSLGARKADELRVRINKSIDDIVKGR